MRSFLSAFMSWAILASIGGVATFAHQTQDDRFDDAGDGSFLLVMRDYSVRAMRLAAINNQSLVLMDRSRGWVTLDLNQCIALISTSSIDNDQQTARGVIVMADGQRLPGQVAVGIEPPADTLAWNHPWLDRVDVPFRLIESVLFTPGAVAPAPANADVILLANGDRQTGFVTAIGDPVSIEIPAADGGAAASQELNIPLDRVTAITMIVPRQQGKGRRVWFSEGTVLDVESVAVGEDGYVRLSGGALIGRDPPRSEESVSQQPRIGVAEVAAILFDREALTPLATIAPTRVEGPATRYTIPRPAAIDPNAPLSLSALKFSGPVVAHFALPAGIRHLVAEAELPPGMRDWGDCELVIRSDDDEIFRTRLNARSPRASISVPLRGRELTIELTAGEHGPIQDHVLLHRAMLLTGS